MNIPIKHNQKYATWKARFERRWSTGVLVIVVWYNAYEEVV